MNRTKQNENRFARFVHSLALLAICATVQRNAFAGGNGGIHSEDVRVTNAPNASIEKRIRALAAAARPRLAKELGVDLPEAFEVRIVADRVAMRAITGDRLGEAVLAVAVPSRQLIVLDRMRLVPGTPDALGPALRHELVHLAFGRLARPNAHGRHVPLWFEEGAAMIFGARVLDLDDDELSLRAAAGTLLPLAGLNDSFPSETSAMRLAYLEAESMVQYLRERWGRGVTRQLIERLRAGATFEAALRAETGLTLAEIETDWTRQLARWERLAAMLVSQRAIFLYGALVAGAAYLLDRRRRKRRLSMDGDGANASPPAEGRAA